MRTLIGTLVGLAVFAAVVMLSLFVGSGGIGEMELAVITVIGALIGYLVARRVMRAVKGWLPRLRSRTRTVGTLHVPRRRCGREHKSMVLHMGSAEAQGDHREVRRHGGRPRNCALRSQCGCLQGPSGTSVAQQQGQDRHPLKTLSWPTMPFVVWLRFRLVLPVFGALDSGGKGLVTVLTSGLPQFTQ